MIKRFTFLVFVSLSITAFSQKSKKPNIILFFADDISAREFSIYGSNTLSPPLVNVADVLPTIAEISGVKIP